MMPLPVASLGWTIGIAVGYPMLAVVLLELQRVLRIRNPEFAGVCALVQASLLPVAALYLLLARVAEVPADSTPLRLVLTLLAVAGMNAALAAFNAVLRTSAFAADWVQRTPGLLLDLVRMMLVGIGAAFVASSIWGIDLGALLTALGVGSIVIGLALQDTLSALFAGVSLMSGRHFKEGDWIEVEDIFGRIVHMDWRSITLETLDDKRRIVLPNSTLTQGSFTVLNTPSLPYGECILVTFAYDNPPAQVMAAIEDAIAAVEHVLDEPSSGIDLIEVSDAGMVYEVSLFTPTREAGDEAHSDFLRKLWYICRRRGLTFSGAANRRYRATPRTAAPPPDDARAALGATLLFPAGAKGFDALAAAAHPALFDEGETLLAVGAPFSAVHFVLDGRLRVRVWGPGEPRVVQEVGPGEVFVARAFLTAGPSPVTVEADEETSTIVLERAAVLAFLSANPGLARTFEAGIDAAQAGLESLPARH